MSKKISDYERRQRKRFGEYLRDLRVSRHIKQQDIEQEFKVNLSEIEKGNRPAPDHLLEELAKIYKVLPEDLLEQRHWPQLLLLTCIIRPTEVTNDKLRDLESEFSPEEIEEITEEVKRYTAFLLLSRHVAV